MAYWYDGPPLLLAFWSQPADTLSPDYYNFQGKDLDPEVDAKTRAQIAKAVAHLTALNPAPRSQLGERGWLMQWRDQSSVPADNRRYRAIAEIRSTPATTQRPSPTAITIYTSFPSLGTARSAGAQILLLLPPFASRTGQVIEPETLMNLVDAIQDMGAYKAPGASLKRVVASLRRTPHVHDLRALASPVTPIDAPPNSEGTILEEGNRHV